MIRCSFRKGILIGRLAVVAVGGLIAANCIASVFLTAVSVDNYPGGEALSRFNDMYAEHKNGGFSDAIPAVPGLI